MTRTNPREFPHFVYLFVLTAAAAGCAKTGTVSGKISVDGKPATRGLVSFLRADAEPGTENASTGTIKRDGTYEVNKVPVGPTKVCIIPDPTAHLRPPGAGRAREQAQKPNASAAPPPTSPEEVPIPPKYKKYDSSGLTLTVHGGTNPFDIEMTSK